MVSTNLGLFMSHKMLLLSAHIPTSSEARPWSKVSFEYDEAMDKVRIHETYMSLGTVLTA